jgi:glycosyltransferase involved in cell wall biosynthesis
MDLETVEGRRPERFGLKTETQASAGEQNECELSILMPCLNERETLVTCIRKAGDFLRRHSIRGEILVADNGSTDGSQALALAAGARVVHVEAPGYGSALRGGIMRARGRYVIMGDSDDSYDFSRLEEFVVKLRSGYELVMGNRFKGNIQPGAMPALHRYLGNPVLTGIGRLFFKSPCGDFHCGLRGFDRLAILRLGLQSPGMEFASEMVVKASLSRLRIAEVPIVLSKDGRSRPPHLRSWHDGWRHLRFLLLFSPQWLFLVPGALLFLGGCLLMASLLVGPRVLVAGVSLDIHTLYYASVATVVGFQAMLFWIGANLYGVRVGIVPADNKLSRYAARLPLEASLIVALILFIVGLILCVIAVTAWGNADFGALSPEYAMRLVIPSGTAILLACHLAFGAFFISLLGLQTKLPSDPDGALIR